MEEWKKAFKLFWFYVRIGFFTFGGGWGIIAQMQKEFVEKEKIITEEELLDITSVGRSLPGTMIGNVSFLFGYHLGGVRCGLATLIGIAFCPFLILSVVTIIYARVIGNDIVMRAMTGIRASVVPIMLYATLPMWKQAMKDKFCYIVMFCALVLCMLATNNIIIVAAGAVIGLVWKGMKKSGNS